MKALPNFKMMISKIFRPKVQLQEIGSLPPRVVASTSQDIPRIIWQTMKSKKIPTTMLDLCRSWMILNPEYEYRFYDDVDIYDFIEAEFPDYFDAYKRIRVGAVKADLWRYLVIYKYGGVYSDVDAICKVALREWIGPSAQWVTHLGVNKDVCQWLIMSVPRNPIFKRAAELARENILKDRAAKITYHGFELEDGRIRLKLDAPRLFEHPIYTLAGPTVLQQAAEQMFLEDPRAFNSMIDVVCVSNITSCLMGGRVAHDFGNQDYWDALDSIGAPHYSTL